MVMNVTNPSGFKHNGVGYLYNNVSFDIESKDKLTIGFQNNPSKFVIDEDGVKMDGTLDVYGSLRLGETLIGRRRFKYLAETQLEIFHNSNHNLLATSITKTLENNRFRIFYRELTPNDITTVWYLGFDSFYTINGSGSDSIGVQIIIDGTVIAYKQVSFVNNGNGSRTGAGTLFPTAGAYSVTEITRHGIEIVVDMTNANDILTIAVNTWSLRLEYVSDTLS
jgi:hypothetical protein